MQNKPSIDFKTALLAAAVIVIAILGNPDKPIDPYSTPDRPAAPAPNR